MSTSFSLRPISSLFALFTCSVLALSPVAARAERAVERTLLALPTGTVNHCFACLAPPIVGLDGVLYGTTSDGPSGATLYAFDPARGGYKVLVNFGPTQVEFPWGYLVDAPDGFFYGVTDFDRRYGGKIYRANRLGRVEIVHTYPHSQGASSLMLASDGNLYGTSVADGANGLGTIFRIDSSGAYTVLYDFSKHAGATTLSPGSQLVQADDGALYGASQGGKNGTGSVWRITLDGTFSVIYSFGSAASGDGVGPSSRLVQGTDGALYGTTGSGGPANVGTVYRVTLDGHERVLHAFDGADGRGPSHGLTQDAEGNLYGTTEEGGDYDLGAFYRITTKGRFAALYRFGAKHSEGIFPEGVTLGSDGNFYGLTIFGGKFNGGAFFGLELK